MEIVWDDILNNVPWDIRRMFKDYEDKISFETKYHLAIALPFAEENKLYMNALIYSLKIAKSMRGMDKLLLYRRAIRDAEKLKSSTSLYTVAYGYIVDSLRKDGLINTEIYQSSKEKLNKILKGIKRDAYRGGSNEQYDA